MHSSSIFQLVSWDAASLPSKDGSLAMVDPYDVMRIDQVHNPYHRTNLRIFVHGSQMKVLNRPPNSSYLALRAPNSGPTWKIL